MAGYGELIKALSENPQDEGSAIAKLEDVDALLKGKDHAAIVEEAAEKTMRCADLLDKALRLSYQFHESMGDAEDKYGAEYNEAIKELIAVDKDVEHFARKVASSGAFTNATSSAKSLLANADSQLASSEGAPTFHDLYMEEFATVFGDELDRFRQDDTFEEKDVSYLISCINSGADVYSPLERALFVNSKST